MFQIVSITDKASTVRLFWLANITDRKYCQSIQVDIGAGKLKHGITQAFFLE